MSSIQIFNEVCEQSSKQAIEKYSTSFSKAVKLLDKQFVQHVFNVYGFVRFADEIVDTFHEHDKFILLNEFKEQAYLSIERGISLNPILHSFQRTVNKFEIPTDLIESFFYSMELDLNKKKYDAKEYKRYIYGSAEVVGLMCLHVFCNMDKNLYQQLEPSARSLGSALQKVNFLRDIKADFEILNRTYFPEVNFKKFTNKEKQTIEADIQKEFDEALIGIKLLPRKARFGVYLAYEYYLNLFNKIKKLSPEELLSRRVRIPDYKKVLIFSRVRFAMLSK